MASFVNRTAELDRLTTCYPSPDRQLAIVYGRRRLGKTELVKQSLTEQSDAVVYQGRQTTQALQLAQFVDRAAAVYPGIEDIRAAWEPLFRYLIDADAIVVLDEFPYLVEQDASLPSVLQALLDYEMDDSAATFVLIRDRQVDR